MRAIALFVYWLTQYFNEGDNWGIVFFRFLLASSLLVLCAWSLINPLIAAFVEAKQMHRIPCSNCRFFTNDRYLKCTIKPCIANTEEAIDCCDYQQIG